MPETVIIAGDTRRLCRPGLCRHNWPFEPPTPSIYGRGEASPGGNVTRLLRRSEARLLRWMRWASRGRLQDDVLSVAARRAGIVIAATPITTQPRPIHAVGVSFSPRKATPSATPIGTRR